MILTILLVKIPAGLTALSATCSHIAPRVNVWLWNRGVCLRCRCNGFLPPTLETVPPTLEVAPDETVEGVTSCQTWQKHTFYRSHSHDAGCSSWSALVWTDLRAAGLLVGPSFCALCWLGGHGQSHHLAVAPRRSSLELQTSEVVLTRCVKGVKRLRFDFIGFYSGSFKVSADECPWCSLNKWVWKSLHKRQSSVQTLSFS